MRPYPHGDIRAGKVRESGCPLTARNWVSLDTKPKPVSGLANYDADFYIKRFNSNSAKEFLKYTKDLERLVNKKGWDLELKYNKQYCGFKAGFFNAFGIQFIGSKTFAFFIKLPEAEAKKVKPQMNRYEEGWKQAVYYIVPGVTKTEDFQKLFEMAYSHLTGK